MYGEIEGRNWRYGPKRKWDKEVKDAQRERGVTIRNAIPLTAVRTRWESLEPSTPLRPTS